jgi:hypothetical protein
MEITNASKAMTTTLLLMPTSCATAQHSAEIDFNKYIGNVKIIVISDRGTNDDEVLTPTLDTSATTGTHATLFATLDHIHGGTNEAATGKVVELNVDASAPLRFGVVTLTPAGTTPTFTAAVIIVGEVRQGATL